MKILIKELVGGDNEVLVYLKTEDDISVKCEIAKVEEYHKVVDEFSEIYDEPISRKQYEYTGMSEITKEHPLVLVCYIDRFTMSDAEVMRQLSTAINDKIVEREANMMAFFLPTDGNERIECINPIIASEDQKEKIDNLIKDISNNFDVGQNNDDYESIAVRPHKD